MKNDFDKILEKSEKMIKKKNLFEALDLLYNFDLKNKKRKRLSKKNKRLLHNKIC